MRCEIKNGDRVVVRLSGDLDTASRDIALPVLQDAVARSPEVVVDLSELAFIDSSGLALLLATDKAARAAGGRLVLRGVFGLVLRVLEVSGTLSLFTLDEA